MVVIRKWKRFHMFLQYNLEVKKENYSYTRFYLRYIFGTPERFYTLLKKGFLWVLYRTPGFHTWPIEPFTKKMVLPFWSSIYEAGDGTIICSIVVCTCNHLSARDIVEF